MLTNSEEVGGGRRRRTHSPDFKAQIVAACSVPGMSSAAVAMAHGINPNLARRWVRAAEQRTGGVPGKAIAKVKPKTKPSAFVPVQLAGPAPASFPDKFPKHPTPSSVAAPADIRIELRRGPLAISVSWPSAAAAQCAAWLRELLR